MVGRRDTGHRGQEDVHHGTLCLQAFLSFQNHFICGPPEVHALGLSLTKTPSRLPATPRHHPCGRHGMKPAIDAAHGRLCAALSELETEHLVAVSFPRPELLMQLVTPTLGEAGTIMMVAQNLEYVRKQNWPENVPPLTLQYFT